MKKRPKARRRMRNLFLVVLGTMVAFVSAWALMQPRPSLTIHASNGEHHYDQVPLTSDLLDHLGGNAEINEAVPVVRSHLEAYNDLMKGAWQLPTDASIDVVLQMHEPPVDTVNAEIDRKVRESHARTIRILRQLHPDVLAIEGLPLDTVTPTTLFLSLRDYHRLHRNGVTDDEITGQVERIYRVDPAVAYSNTRSDLVTVGAEMLELNELHTGVIGMIFLRNRPHAQDSLTSAQMNYADSANVVLTSTRSIVAVGRLVRAMTAHHAKHGCLVIGADHGHDIPIIFRDAGIHGRVFDTTR